MTKHPDTEITRKLAESVVETDYQEIPEEAVAAFYKEGKSLTYDQGGDATTMGCAEAILRKIK